MEQRVEKQEDAQASKETEKKTTNPVLRMELTVGTIALGLFIDLVVSGPGEMFGQGGAPILALFAFLTAIAYEAGVDIVTWFQKIKREWAPYLPGGEREQIQELVEDRTKTRVLAPSPKQEYQEKVEEEKMPPLPLKPATTVTRNFDNEDMLDELERYQSLSSLFTLSQILREFTPSSEAIYLGKLTDRSVISSDARGLCHVAIAGHTGGGKSNILRLLIAQLCYSGASVLLLNPHYTHYDLEHNEDWTPYEPYLVHDPMECRKYEAIRHYLAQVATVLLPKRLEKYAYSQPLGKPYFLVLDELPAIIANVPDAPRYMSAILREGRKVGIFLVTASHDFLVKTISPQGGGAIRDCYRTAFYVGGDPITARVLLDIPANQVQENILGKGTVMLRSQTCKQASLASIPYVDNQALYDLLGPSTYIPGKADRGDDQFLEQLPFTGQEYAVQPGYDEPTSALPMKTGPIVVPTTMTAPLAPRTSLRGRYAREIEVWNKLEAQHMANMRNFADAMDINRAKAYDVLCEMEKLHLITWEKKKTKGL